MLFSRIVELRAESVHTPGFAPGPAQFDTNAEPGLLRPVLKSHGRLGWICAFDGHVRPLPSCDAVDALTALFRSPGEFFDPLEIAVFGSDAEPDSLREWPAALLRRIDLVAALAPEDPQFLERLEAKVLEAGWYDDHHANPIVEDDLSTFASIHHRVSVRAERHLRREFGKFFKLLEVEFVVLRDHLRQCFGWHHGTCYYDGALDTTREVADWHVDTTQR